MRHSSLKHRRWKAPSCSTEPWVKGKFSHPQDSLDQRQVRTDSSNHFAYFYGDNGTLLTRRYNNTITLSLSHKTIDNCKVASENADGSQSNASGFYSWTGGQRCSGIGVLFIDLKIIFYVTKIESLTTTGLERIPVYS